jgi:aminoglycoside phosphotransferase (APT) family kinase protein
MFWLEEEQTDLLGASFYVMGQVQGRVPSDNPPYHQQGWMTEATPAEREAIWWGGIDCMAAIHKLDYEAAGFAFLDKPELGETPLDQQLAYYKNYLEWAARGKPQPTVEAGLEWLEKNKPQNERKGIVWGDARIGNIIFDGTRPAAVLDWEMVSLGSPEADLAWTVFLDRHHSEGIETPRLEGFPSYEETVSRYEESTGFKVRNLHYYQAFAGFRFGVIMMRLAQQLVEYEIMDAEAGYAYELSNTVTRLLAKILDLPAPGKPTSGFSS